MVSTSVSNRTAHAVLMRRIAAVALAFLAWSSVFIWSSLLVADDGVSPEVMLGLNTSGHNGHITRVLIDRMRSQLISVSHDKTIRFWDLATFAPVRVLRPPMGRGQVGELYSASLSPDGAWLAVSGFTAPEGSNDHSVLLISLPEGRLVRRLQGNTLPVQDVAFSPNGRWLAAGGTDGVLRIWETANWTLARVLPGHTMRIDGMAWHPDSSRMVTASWDKTCRFWSINDGTSIPIMAHGNHRVFCVAYSPDGQTVATGGGDNWVKLWDPEGRLRSNLVGAPEYFETLAFSPDGTRLLYGYGGKQTNPLAAGLVRLTDRVVMTQYFGHLDTVKCSVFTPDGRYVIIGDSDDQICVWEADTGRLVRRLRSEGLPIYSTGFSSDGKTVGWGYSHVPGSSLHATNPLQRAFSLERLEFAPMPDYSFMRAQAVMGPFSIARSSYRMATVSQFGTPISRYYDPNITIRSRTLLPGNRAALGCDQSVLVFDVLTGRSIYRLPGHLDAVWAVTPSPDQRHLLTGSDDETLQIWNLERYEHTLSLFFAGDDWVAWTPQGYYAASPGGENYVGWHVQRGFDEMATYYPASRFHARFFRPDVIRRVLAQGGPIQALKELDRIKGSDTRLIDIRHSLPPQVTLTVTSNPTGAPIANTIRVQATARVAEGDAIRSMRLLIDGRPGPETHDREALAPPPAPEAAAAAIGSHVSWDVELLPGKHRLHVKAESDRSIGMSDPVPVEVDVAKATRPRLFVLSIGVAGNQRFDLRRSTSVIDAQAIAAAFSKPSPQDFRDFQASVLIDQQVTRFNFEEGLRWLERSMSDDDVGVIYYSGYAVRDAQDNVYLQHFESRPGDPAAGVSDRVLREFLQRTGGKILLLMDVITRDESALPPQAITVAAPVPNAASTGERGSLEDLVRQLASDDYGIAVLANINTHEAATNHMTAGRSPFAQSILDGLSGKADPNGNGIIGLRELIQYVRGDVRQRTNSDQHTVAAQPALQPFVSLGRHH